MFEPKKKKSCGRLVLASEMQVGSFWDRGDHIEAGYTGVEVQGGCDWVRCERGPVWAKNQKPNHRGSVLASKMWVGLILDRGDPIRAEYTGIEVQGGHN